MPRKKISEILIYINKLVRYGWVFVFKMIGWRDDQCGGCDKIEMIRLKLWILAVGRENDPARQQISSEVYPGVAGGWDDYSTFWHITGNEP
ncbi:MAG: hypothetical protein KKB30_07115 [Proteobacteria bacterium]|nr:hypothetical protein [Pseudomonadota bacterium]MBU1714200.1 hypothetical protein [Pseudomonadota bacterium]